MKLIMTFINLYLLLLFDLILLRIFLFAFYLLRFCIYIVHPYLFQFFIVLMHVNNSFDLIIYFPSLLFYICINVMRFRGVGVVIGVGVGIGRGGEAQS